MDEAHIVKAATMTSIRVVLCAGLFLSGATPVLATSITNQDSKEHTVTVDHGAKEEQVKIAAGKTVQADCPDGCGFHTEDSGYGRETGNDGKLVISKEGRLSLADEAK